MLGAFRGWFSQQVPNGLVIYFQVRQRDLDRLFVLEFLHALIELLHGQKNDSWLLRGATDRMRLSTPSSSVSEQCPVIPVQYSFNQVPRRVLENLA